MYRVFSRKWYLLLATTVACITYISLVFIQYSGLMRIVVEDAGSPLYEKSGLLFAILFAPLQNFIKEPTTTLFPILFGINVTLLVFYHRLFKATSATSLGGGLLGSLVAFFGIGCAACGSLFIATLSATGASLLVYLPFQGAELGYLGLFLLLVSTIFLARAINKPVVCPI